MCITIKNEFDNKLSFINLYYAHLRARKSKRSKKEVLIFEMDMETNLINLYNSIKKGTYKTGKYREFKVYEPKERIIKALPYRDRIVHQWYVEEFIKPYYMPRFIKDTFACIDGRGAHAAVDSLQKYMRSMKKSNCNYYILKCDIRKFFYNIDKDILMKILTKRISDKKLLNFTKKLIYNDTNDVGIPIGNYTSQFFANIYLNELDYFVKNQLHIKYYIRYMDDFIFLLNDKSESKIIKSKIEKFVNYNLHLELNNKSNYYPSYLGVDFCGYRIYENYRFLRKRSKKKIKQNIKKWNRLYLLDKTNMNYKKISQQWNSWLGHSTHANTYNLQCSLYDKIIFNNLLKNPNVLK